MPDEKQQASNQASDAGQSVDKKPEADAGNKALVAEIAELKARLAKETKDKESYRAGLLAKKEYDKAKKKEAVDLSDPEKADEYIDAKLQARELEQKAASEAAERADELEKLKREAAEKDEMLRSYQAKATAAGNSGFGSGVSNTESKPQGYWSDAQRAELRQILSGRGLYSAEQIEGMVKRAETIAQAKTAQLPDTNHVTPKRKY